MSWKHSLKGFVAAAVLLLTASCVPPAMQKATSATDVTPGKTIVVMKVELVPALKKNEQHFQWSDIGTDELVNTVLYLTDEKFRRFKEEPGLADYKNRMGVKLGETSYMLTDNKPFYALTGMIVMGWQPTPEKLYLPAGFKVDIRQGDQAVYLGTIRYYRDEFSDITKVEIIDEYRREVKKFHEKFGAGVKLRKRLVVKK